MSIILQAAYHAPSKTVTIQPNNAALPGNNTLLGKFDHPDEVYPGSKVIYQEVQELLYHVGEQNMQIVTIKLANGLVAEVLPAAGVYFGDGKGADINLTVGDKIPLKYSVTPPNAQNKNVAFESSAPDIVSVDSEGNIEALDTGSASIMVETESGSHTATQVVNVAANPS